MSYPFNILITTKKCPVEVLKYDMVLHAETGQIQRALHDQRSQTIYYYTICDVDKRETISNDRNQIKTDNIKKINSFQIRSDAKNFLNTFSPWEISDFHYNV